MPFLLPLLAAGGAAAGGASAIGATAAGLGGAALGAIGGALGSKKESSVDAGDPTAMEIRAGDAMGDDYSRLQAMVNAGPGAGDVANATESTRSLADMLKQYMSPGGANPTAGDITQGTDLAKALFGYQQTALDQSFQDQGTDYARLSARLGREANDPILQAKMRTGQVREQALLDASKGGFAREYSMNQPMQRLNFASQRSSLLGGLATQAMSNRQAILGLGSQIQSGERNWRLQTATRQDSSGGGLAGALSGGIGGFSAGLGIADKMGGMFSSAPGTSAITADYGFSGGYGGAGYTGNAYGGRATGAQQ